MMTLFSSGKTAVLREICGELDAVLRYEVEATPSATV